MCVLMLTCVVSAMSIWMFGFGVVPRLREKETVQKREQSEPEIEREGEREIEGESQREREKEIKRERALLGTPDEFAPPG